MQVGMRESNDLRLVSISHFSVINKLPYRVSLGEN
jgi:hypothetical protein